MKVELRLIAPLGVILFSILACTTSTTAPEPELPDCPGKIYYPSDKEGTYYAQCCPENTHPEDLNGTGLPESCVPYEASSTDGASMQWVDGSKLVALQSDTSSANGPQPHLFWAFAREVTRYQFYLCVLAKQCLALEDQQLEEQGLGSPDDAGLPIQIGDPNLSEAYCMWVGARLPSSDEMETIQEHLDSHGDLASPSSELGFRCVVDTPHAMTPACQKSAFYDPTKPSPEPIEPSFTQTGQFCQNGQGYATGKLDLPAGAHLVQVQSQGEATCEIVDDDSFVCYAAAVNDGQVTGYVMDETAPDVHLTCQLGYELNPGMPAQCDYAVDGLEMGCPMGTIPTQLEGGAYYCMMEQSGPMVPIDDDPFITDVPMELLYPPEKCPAGMYLDIGLNACVSPGPYSEGCRPGFELDSALGCCALPPGPKKGYIFPCPDHLGYDPVTGTCDVCQQGYVVDPVTGMCVPDTTEYGWADCLEGLVYNPETGACDPFYIYVLGGALHRVQASLQLPECSTQDDSKCGSFGSAAACNAAGCTWDASSRTCK